MALFKRKEVLTETDGGATLWAVEGVIELTPTALVLHGINRFQGAVTIPLRNIATMHAKTATESGGMGHPVLEITTNDGSSYARRSRYDAYADLVRFVELATS